MDLAVRQDKVRGHCRGLRLSEQSATGQRARAAKELSAPESVSHVYLHVNTVGQTIAFCGLSRLDQTPACGDRRQKPIVYPTSNYRPLSAPGQPEFKWYVDDGPIISTRRIFPFSIRNASLTRMLEGRLKPLNAYFRPSESTPSFTVP
jgi:hypothetical protein